MGSGAFFICKQTLPQPCRFGFALIAVRKNDKDYGKKEGSPERGVRYLCGSA